MSEIIAWMAAEADREESRDVPPAAPQERKSGEGESTQRPLSLQHMPVHQFPATGIPAAEKRSEEPDWAKDPLYDPLYQETDLEADIFEQQRRRRVYRGRTAAMLHRYMRYSLETGRIPSILGGDIFRSKVTSYGVSTFEDRAIFVHDMERCLQRLDGLLQQVVARVVLQGHNREDAARLIGCTSRTIHRNLMEALDRMADILLEVGLLEEIPVEAPREPCAAASLKAPDSPVEKSCQGGEATDFLLSDCEDGK